jgi:hypothetical protein
MCLNTLYIGLNNSDLNNELVDCSTAAMTTACGPVARLLNHCALISIHKMQKDVRDQILIHFILYNSQTTRFYRFCDEAVDKSTKKLYFGPKGSEERQRHRERLKFLTPKVNNGAIRLREGFDVAVSVVVYRPVDCYIITSPIIVQIQDYIQMSSGGSVSSSSDSSNSSTVQRPSSPVVSVQDSPSTAMDLRTALVVPNNRDVSPMTMREQGRQTLFLREEAHIPEWRRVSIRHGKSKIVPVLVNTVAEKESDDKKKMLKGEYIIELRTAIISELLTVDCLAGITFTFTSSNFIDMKKKKFRLAASQTNAIIMRCPTGDSHMKGVQAQLIAVLEKKLGYCPSRDVGVKKALHLVNEDDTEDWMFILEDATNGFRQQEWQGEQAKGDPYYIKVHHEGLSDEDGLPRLVSFFELAEVAGASEVSDPEADNREEDEIDELQGRFGGLAFTGRGGRTRHGGGGARDGLRSGGRDERRGDSGGGRRHNNRGKFV